MLNRRTFMGAALAAPAVFSSVSAFAQSKRLSIALLQGFGYAPLTLAKQGRWLEDALPGTKVDWRVVASSAVTREGMLAGEIDVGAGSVAPFLIGRDRGLKIGLVSALNVIDLWMVTNDPAITSLKDFTPAKKIAMPGPDTNQAFLVRYAAQQQLGDARALDGNFQPMPHPDALQAIITNQVAAYMSSPPFQNEAVKRGARKILDGESLFGPLTFNVCFASAPYAKNNPEQLAALREAIKRGTNMLNTDVDGAAKQLSADRQGNVSAETFKALIEDKTTKFTSEPEGVAKLADFMRTTGFLRNAPGALEEMTL